MRRLLLMLVVAVVFLARPAWPADQPGPTGRPVGAPQPWPAALNISSTAVGAPTRDAGSPNAPVLFVPAGPETHGSGAGTDNYGRPIQPRVIQ